jgi:membrane associated rhomboid family serine protease
MAYRSRSGLRGIFYTPGFPPGVKWLLLSNVAVFILGFFAQLLQLDRPLSAFALFPVDVVRHLKIWQLGTYLFLHGGFGHIIWNMLALWMFGAELERTWGTRKFLQFYFFCGVGAGICVVLANYLLPWGNPAVATIGSSGAIFGFLSSFQVNSGVSEFAHLGGMLFGYLFLKKPRNVQLDLAGPVRRRYQEWKLQRAKKKFQVYLRKQGSNRDPWIH